MLRGVGAWRGFTRQETRKKKKKEKKWRKLFMNEIKYWVDTGFI